jgi:hypothetical protein
MNSFSPLTNSSSISQRQAHQQARQQLEQLWQVSSPAPLPVAKTPWYKHLAQWLVQALTDSDQVRVWTKITPNGTQWCAYDPLGDRRFSGYSEADLRTWLEQRYR